MAANGIDLLVEWPNLLCDIAHDIRALDHLVELNGISSHLGVMHQVGVNVLEHNDVSVEVKDLFGKLWVQNEVILLHHFLDVAEHMNDSLSDHLIKLIVGTWSNVILSWALDSVDHADETINDCWS